MPESISSKGNKNVAYEASPRFSFAREEKLRLPATPAPGVGKYSPVLKHVGRAAPEHVMGKAAKEDSYWEKRLRERSPGPVYSYVRDMDSFSKYRLRRVVCIEAV